MKKKIAIIMAAVSVLAGCTATPTFAYVEDGTEAYWDESGGYEETYTEDSGYVPVEGEIPEAVSGSTEAETGGSGTPQDGSTDASAGEQSVENAQTAEEDNPPLTPEGNMSLVDDVTTSSGAKEFLTLTSRAGNFYYLVIDRDKDGNSNVHFLNQVDERDLISIMDEDEAKELEESITQKAEAEKAAEEAKKAQEEAAAAAAEPAPEATPAPEKTVTIAGYEFSKSVVTAVFGLAILIIILLAAFFLIGKKKKAENNKEDPDADYDEDYGEEVYIPEGETEDGDYEE